MTDERSLSDPVEQREALSVVDFARGFRARRLPVRMRPNLHLLDDLERLVDEIDAAPEDADIDDLLDAYDAARAEYEREARWVVEQRSPERSQRVREDAIKALGYATDDEGALTATGATLEAQQTRLGVEVALDHIVAPEGLTVDDLTGLAEASPSEWTKLVRALAQVQQVTADDERVLRDFSSRRSGRTRRRSKR